MTPDLILYNGLIHTQDEAFSFATAIALSNSRISALGRDQDILCLATSKTRLIDLDQRLVLPGFCDSHFHFHEWAKNIDSLDLAPLNSFAQMETLIQDRAQVQEKGSWILGQGFNESDWPENRMPNRRDLDRLAPDHPLCIWRCDCHLAVANSLALSLAGIDADTPNPEEGVIDRDGAGEATGILKETAPNLIKACVPEPSPAQLMGNMEKAMNQVHGLGLTAIHDIRLMGGMEGAKPLHDWTNFFNTGKLKLRCHVTLPGEMTDQAIEMGLTTGFGNDLLKIGWLKFFADGGMGARTAWMTQPYLDADCGMPLTPIADIEAAVKKADQAGLSCMVHAIGDRACQEIIHMFARVEKAGQSQCSLPHRVEHLQFIRPRDLDSLAKLSNLVTSCQPNNLSLDISMVEQAVGDQGKFAYTLKSILGTGLPMMLSSDAPVADFNPMAGIYSAVTRKRMDHTPEKGWYPEQALTVAQAVRAYTLTPAQASGNGDLTGSLTPGKKADLVVLDKNIYDIPCDEISHTRNLMTIFDGEIVFQAPGQWKFEL